MATQPVRRLDANHDMTFGRGFRNIATLAEATQQRLRCRLLSVLGNWFLDQDHGIPWWGDGSLSTLPIMGGQKNLGYAEAVLKAAILATDGVATLDAFSIATDPKTRRMTVSCRGQTVDGGAFVIVDAGP